MKLWALFIFLKRALVNVSVNQQQTVQVLGISTKAQGKLDFYSVYWCLGKRAVVPASKLTHILPWFKSKGGKSLLPSVPALISVTKFTLFASE